MFKQIIFLCITLLLIGACVSNKNNNVLFGFNNANVSIPANQEFVLGEYAKKNYRASLENKGSTLIQIRVLSKTSGEVMKSENLGIGDKLGFEIMTNQTVYMVNDNDEQGRVFVKLSKGVSGMRYQNLN